MTPIELTTAVNNLYEQAILEFLAASNAPVDNGDLAFGVLGGNLEQEVRMQSAEPFAGAMLNLARDGRIVGIKDPETGYAMYMLTERATEAQRAEHAAVFAAESDALAGYSPNDPSTYRRHADAIIEEIRAEDASIGQLLRDLFESSQDDGAVH